jgi:hypothetical protein
MVDIVNGKVAPVGTTGGTTPTRSATSGFGAISKPVTQPVTTSSQTNRNILKKLGIDLDTILTPYKSRKLKRNGKSDNPLRGEPDLKTALGE